MTQQLLAIILTALTVGVTVGCVCHYLHGRRMLYLEMSILRLETELYYVRTPRMYAAQWN